MGALGITSSIPLALLTAEVDEVEVLEAVVEAYYVEEEVEDIKEAIMSKNFVEEVMVHLKMELTYQIPSVTLKINSGTNSQTKK